MMSRTFTCGVILTLFLLVPIVQAEESMKFGYVDIQKVIFSSAYGQTEVQKLKDFQEKRQKKISDVEEQLNQMEREFQKQSFTLTEDAKNVKGEEIRTKKLELKRLLEDSEYELDRRKKAMLDLMQQDIVLIIQKLGTDEKYSLILEVTGSNVVYANTAYDITDRVVALYDKSKTK
ncbi:OmpH family outer membrane protein [bacterium]|nr:OmpH family outer membrane protein [bacterium]